MHHSPILAPVVALVAWSLVMHVDVRGAARRFRRPGSASQGRRGARGVELEGGDPDEANGRRTITTI